MNYDLKSWIQSALRIKNPIIDWWLIVSQNDHRRETLDHLLVVRYEEEDNKIVVECVTLPLVKVDHQKPYGKLQQEIPEWKWNKIAMDFVTKLPKNAWSNDMIWMIAYRMTKPLTFWQPKKMRSWRTWQSYMLRRLSPNMEYS